MVNEFIGWVKFTVTVVSCAVAGSLVMAIGAMAVVSLFANVC